MGLNNFNNRNIAQNSKILNKHFSNLVVLKFYFAVAYFVVSMLFAIILGYESSQIKLLLLLVFNQFLLSFLLYLRSNISGLQLFRTDSIISVLDRLILIAICSVLLFGKVTQTTFRIEWLVYAQTAAYVLTCTVAFFIVVRKVNFFRLKFDKTFCLVILKRSFPFALLTLLQSIYFRVDSVMLERMLENGQTHAGIYAQSFRILDAVSMFAFLFASLLLPMFSRMFKDNVDTNQLLRFSYLLLIVPSLILATSGFFYGNDIMTLFYDAHIQESSKIYVFLMIGFTGIATSYIFGTLLTAKGALTALNTMAAIGLVINIVLNAVLIPRYQGTGAAFSSMVTQLFTALMQVLIAKRICKFKINIHLLLSLIFYVVILVIIGYITKNYIENMLYAFVLMIIVSIIIAFIFNILNIKNMYEIIKHGDIK